MAAADEKFRQVRAFRNLLAEFSIMNEGEGTGMLLVHSAGCNEGVCDVEQDDSMDVLVETVIQHEC